MAGFKIMPHSKKYQGELKKQYCKVNVTRVDDI